MCHCTVGVEDPRNPEPCDPATKTLTCAPGGICAVGLSGDRVVQRCMYKQFTIQTCPTSNELLCCKVDLCNSIDNFTEFRASQTNNIGSSTNTAASSSSSMTSVVITPSTVGKFFSFVSRIVTEVQWLLFISRLYHYTIDHHC